MAARPARDSGGKTGGKTGGSNTGGIPKLDAETLLTLYTKGKRDFASYNLSMLAIPKINLSGAVFHQSNLKQINLQGANLFNADFGRASLNRANLRDANLAQAYLLNANLRGANLCGTNLTGAKLTEEQLAMAKTNWLTVRPNGKRGIL
jgi:serine/threonine protein kinase, bacterial